LKSIITQKELVDYCKQNPDIDFIARCITPWHLLGIKAFVNRLKYREKRTIKGIIFIMAHSLTGYAIDSSKIDPIENITAKIYDIQESFFHGNNLSKGIRNILMPSFRKGNCNYKSLYIISPMKSWSSLSVDILNANCKYNISNIVIDDGFLSYESKFQMLLKQFAETKSIASFFKNIIQFPYEYALQNKYNYEKIHWALFQKNHGKFIANYKVVNCYKKILEMDSSRQIGCQIEDNFQNDYVIIITQPFEDHDLDYKLFVQERLIPIKNYFSSKNVDVYIKPHPRERTLEYYNQFKLLNYNGPIEQFTFSCKKCPLYFIGIYSTALVTINLFSGIKTISLSKLVEPYVKNKNLKYSIRLFANKFSDYVTIC
jgi:hypothetical protein